MRNQQTPLTLTEYQLKAFETAVYPRSGERKNGGLVYCALKMVSEAGEVADKLGKGYRGDAKWPYDAISDPDTSTQGMTPEARDQMVKELGDVLWYVAGMASELGVSLDEVARQNLEKLQARSQAGTLKGSGDNR